MSLAKRLSTFRAVVVPSSSGLSPDLVARGCVLWCLSKQELCQLTVRTADEQEQQIQEPVATVPFDIFSKRVESLCIHAKRKQPDLSFRRMYWIFGRRSELSLVNKLLLLYKTILKPIWTYGIPLWGTASHSNIEILQRFQNKVLRTIVNAPWHRPNGILHTDRTASYTLTEQHPTHRPNSILHTDRTASYTPTCSYQPSEKKLRNTALLTKRNYSNTQIN